MDSPAKQEQIAPYRNPWLAKKEFRMPSRNYGYIFRKFTPFVACLAIFAGMLSCAAPGNSPKAMAGPPRVAPDFSLLDSNGATLTLSDYKGKVVLLDFWATWCGGCKTEIPWYMEFENKYKDNGLAVIGVSLAVIGVSMDTDWKTVKPFLAEEKMNYPVVIGNEALLAGYGSLEMPATYLIDRDGRIADYHIGVVNKDQFEGEIKKLLAKEGSQASP
jgi:peroxiredoxin